MNRFDADVIIIGSGFGGSVCALRAAQAGLRVIVLERGPKLNDDAWRSIAEGKRPLINTLDRPAPAVVHRVRGLLCVSGCAVGGGSHVYTAVTMPACPEIFTDAWPAGINAETMAPCFQRVATVIAPRPTPLPLDRTLRLERAARTLKAQATRLPLAMNWPDDVSRMRVPPAEASIRDGAVRWLQGGGACRKRTLDQTYLSAARTAGAEIRSLHEVSAIIPEPGGYSVAFKTHNDEYRATGRLRGRRVVLAAGTLGALRLLFFCRDGLRTLPNVSPALGSRFFTNGDMGGLLVCHGRDAPTDSGPPVTSWLDLWDKDRMYLMELGRLPVPSFIERAAALFGASIVARERAAGWAFGVMGAGETPGRLKRRPGGRLVYERGAPYPTPYDLRVRERINDLAEALDARAIVPPVAFLKRFAVTVHPLGGACMADAPTGGVCDSFGEVFGHPGLYVADGSLLPTPIGRAPSMTIAALAERVVEHLTQSGQTA